MDDLGVASMTDKLRLTMHTPKKKGAVIRPYGFNLPGATNIACQVRSAPLWLEQERRFRFLVANCNGTNSYVDKHGSHAKPQWYTSTDAVQWIHESNAGSDVPEQYMVVYDPKDKPAARYKSMIPDQKGASGGGAMISPDGIRWVKLPVVAFGIETSDEQNLSYDHVSGRFIYTVKRGNKYGRAVALATTTDFYSTNWTDFGVVFGADADDQKLGRKRIAEWLKTCPDALVCTNEFCPNDPPGREGSCWNEDQFGVDVYNMAAFRYESLFLGFPALFHTINGHSDGFDAIELVSSRDMRLWNRVGNRSWFIAPSRAGSGAFDMQQLIGPSNVLLVGEELFMFYTCLKYRGREPPLGHEPLDLDAGAICLATLRR